MTKNLHRLRDSLLKLEEGLHSMESLGNCKGAPATKVTPIFRYHS